MSLRLTIISAQRFAPGQVAAKTLGAGRLTVGRGAGNDWVLPDPERVVSKDHCVIEGAGTEFRLTDTSTNGVFVDDSDQPIGQGGTHALRNGERLRLGAYEIAVEIDGTDAAAADEATGIGLGLEFTSAAGLFREPSPLPDAFAESGPRLPSMGGDDPFAPRPAAGRQRLADLEPGPPIDRPFEPQRPAVAPAPPPPAIPEDWDAEPPSPPPPARSVPVADIPEDWAELERSAPAAAAVPRPEPPSAADAFPADPFAVGAAAPSDPFATRIEPVPDAPPPPPSASPLVAPVGSDSSPGPATAPIAQPPTTSRPAPPPGDVAAALRAFLEGAQLDPSAFAHVDAERTLRDLGAIWRIVVAGFIDVLDSRRAIKSEFRLGQTEFRRAENNPLKFSLGGNETMRMLLSPPERGWLPPVEAFAEAFADLREHQVAVLAGMQEAWCDLLRRLDPQAIDKRLGEEGGFGGLLGSRKGRCWDEYVRVYADIVEEGRQGSDSLLARKFAEGYERQVGKQDGG